MERRVALAFWVTIVGGLLLASSYVADVPNALAVLGAALFVGGAILVAVATTAGARATGRLWFASLWTGVRTAFRWLLAMMP